jgi:hypothetical protein
VVESTGSLYSVGKQASWHPQNSGA